MRKSEKQMKKHTIFMFLIVSFSIAINFITVNAQQSNMPPFVLENAKTYLITPTHDGSGQVVHPDILKFEGNILPNGYHYIMAITPYPLVQFKINETEETPNILFSKNGLIWEVGPANNPVCPRLGVEPDPSLVYVNGTFYLYWGQYKIDGVVAGYGSRMSSVNGYEWNYSRRQDMQNWRGEVIYDPIDRKFKNWIGPYSGGYIIYEESEDGLYWTQETYPFPLPNDVIATGAHAEVERLSNGEYWMIFGATILYVKDNVEPPIIKEISCRWFAKSYDGKHWTGYYSKPVIKAGAIDSWDDDVIYKAHFIVENGKIRYWYSARNSYIVWHLGYTEAVVDNLDPAIYTVTNVFKDHPVIPLHFNINILFVIFLIVLMAWNIKN